MSGSQATAGGVITAAWLNLNIPGPWLSIATGGDSSTSSGWVNHGGTSVTYQARQYNSVTLEIIGIVGGGSTASTTIIGHLPAPLPRPVTVQPGFGQIIAGTGAGSVFEIIVQNDGTIQLPQAITGATEIGFHFFVSLDA